MHELSICGSIADIVTRRAAGRPVQVINVRVGQLRQVVPDTLVYCWELVSAETPLEGSRISIEAVPARIRCRACDQVTDVGAIPGLRLRRLRRLRRGGRVGRGVPDYVARTGGEHLMGRFHRHDDGTMHSHDTGHSTTQCT